MAQTIAITTVPITIFGNKKIVYGTFDANGTASGLFDTNMEYIEVCFVCNSEAHTEDIKLVKNSNDGTEGTASGYIYFTAPDGTNNTADWIAIGI